MERSILCLLLVALVANLHFVAAQAFGKCRPTPSANSDFCAKVVDHYGVNSYLTFTNEFCLNKTRECFRDHLASFCHKGRCISTSSSKCPS